MNENMINFHSYKEDLPKKTKNQQRFHPNMVRMAMEPMHQHDAWALFCYIKNNR